MNPGKQFELDFKNSIPESVWYYRFKDGTSNWDNSDKSNTRFQHKNISDCELYEFPYLFLLELKSTKEKRIPFTMVRDNQMKELSEASVKRGIIAGFIVNFREFEETYFMPISQYNYYKGNFDSKSIPLIIFRENCMRIDQRKLIKNYRYDLGEFIKRAGEREKSFIKGI